MIAGSPTVPWTLKILPEWITIQIEAPCDDFEEVIAWLNKHDPDWEFTFAGTRESCQDWYRDLALDNAGNVQQWHLRLSKSAAMLARLTWDTWLKKSG